LLLKAASKDVCEAGKSDFVGEADPASVEDVQTSTPHGSDTTEILKPSIT